jgi:predicted enzyme related to lactoylglutathione lyase
MSNNNHIDLIEFPAKSPEELKATTDFFTAVFGWKYKDWGGVYSDTSDSGLTSGVIAAEPNKPTMPLAVIYSKNLEETKEKVIKAGGKIIADIYTFPGGRRFHFTDPAGNELAVWSE